MEASMPETSAKILAQLNAKKLELDEMTAYGNYISGNKVTEKPEILFQRLDVNEILEKAAEIQAAQMAEAGVSTKCANEEVAKEDEAVIDIEPKEEITYEDFMKMQFQVGEIIICEEVKKSKKLFCAENAEGELALMVPEKTMPAGAEIC